MEKLKISRMGRKRDLVQLHQVNLLQEKVCFGLGVPFIVSYCRAKPEISSRFDVRHVNWTLDNWRRRRRLSEEIASFIADSRPAVAGFSLFLWSLTLLIDVIRKVKKRDPGIIIIVGGPCASSMRAELMRQVPQIDYLVAGEGEDAFAGLLAGISEAGSGPKKKTVGCVEGVCRRVGKNRIDETDTSAVVVKDLDSLGSPVREGLIETTPEEGALIFEWTRGCPYRCNYCCWSIQTYPMRRFSKDYIMKDVRWTVEKGFREVTVCDSAINHSDHYLGELCSALVEADPERKFTFGAFFQYNRVTPKQLSMLEHVKCVRPMIGLETDDEYGLRALNHPPFKKDKFERSVSLLKTLQAPFVTMMTAVPGDTVDRIKRRVDYILSLGCSMTIFPLCVPPGTGLWNARGKHGFEIDPKNMFVVRQIPTMSFEQYEKVMEYVSSLSVDAQQMEIYSYHLLGFDQESKGPTS